MKREEKNLLSRNRILDSALAEFARHGYAGGSINAICAAGSISKGNLYHYFKDKDALYLTCVQSCFDALTAYLHQQLTDYAVTLESYFDARMAFFRENPLYQRIFCDVHMMPPPHLRADIRTCSQDFERLNLAKLSHLFSSQHLRADLSQAEAIEDFRLFQDLVNARLAADPCAAQMPADYERICRRVLQCYLYGVIARD